VEHPRKRIVDELLIEMYRSARELPIPEFRDAAIGRIKTTLKFDSAMWGAGQIQPSTGLGIQCIHLHNQTTEMLLSYEQIKGRDHAALEAVLRPGEACNFNLQDMFAGPVHAKVRAHHLKFNMQHLLVGMAPDKPSASMNFLFLWREEEQNHYTEQEQRLGNFVLPHLLEAGAINASLWQSQATATLLGKQSAQAISDEHGKICALDGEFLAVLRREWPDWQPPTLPPQLMGSMGRLSALTFFKFFGAHIAVMINIVRGMLFLLAREKLAVDNLTAAERSVAVLIASGISYKEVAKQLKLSPATVRNELHHAYVKLGISDKAALSQHLKYVDA
jgi:DNA-binding CsgD family transcriptional regulator